MQRIYYGRRSGDGSAFVLVEQDGRKCRLDPEPSLALRRHSPTGFEWGYGGSGPAQLALALLLDHFGSADVAQQRYQDFKFAVVGRMPKDEWQLTDAEITMWLQNHQDNDEAKARDYFTRKWDGGTQL